MVLAVLALMAISLPRAAAQTLECDGKAVTIKGTPGNDELVGTSGADVIHGLAGNDKIIGLGGNDTICGGRGRDLIRPGSGADVIFGGSGHDRVSYSTMSRPIATESLAASGGRSAIAVRIGGRNGSVVDHVFGVERIIGTHFDDELGAPDSWTGGRSLRGLKGNDAFGSGASAADGLTFIGDVGSDKAFISSEGATFLGGKGDDWFQCHTGCTAKTGPGNDAVSNNYFTGSGPIVAYLGSGDDIVYARQSTRIVAHGGPGDDLFGGSPYDDTFYGGAGADTFYGDGGRDTCYGGRGKDTSASESTCVTTKSIEVRFN